MIPTLTLTKVVSACNLKPADVSGFSDPFVTVEWDGCEQISKVISSNLNPSWNETLYFPLKCALDRAVLEQKPCVSVRVYDLDESGSDLLGQCEVPLHKITSAVLAKIDDEVLPSGDCHKGRVLKLERQVLLLPDQYIESSIDLWLYFTPDLPLDIVLEDRSGKGHTGRSLDTDYEQRLRSWYEDLPEWVRKSIEEAQRLEMDYEPLFDRKALVSAEDQDAHVHFFCEFLTPVLPPRELTEVGAIARMVRMMSWSSDDETFRGARRDVWQSPNFFMELRKGDFEVGVRKAHTHTHARARAQSTRTRCTLHMHIHICRTTPSTCATYCWGSSWTPTYAWVDCTTRQRVRSGTYG